MAASKIYALWRQGRDKQSGFVPSELYTKVVAENDRLHNERIALSRRVTELKAELKRLDRASPARLLPARALGAGG
jgi:hypothetical protein